MKCLCIFRFWPLMCFSLHYLDLPLSLLFVFLTMLPLLLLFYRIWLAFCSIACGFLQHFPGSSGIWRMLQHPEGLRTSFSIFLNCVPLILCFHGIWLHCDALCHAA